MTAPEAPGNLPPDNAPGGLSFPPPGPMSYDPGQAPTAPGPMGYTPPPPPTRGRRSGLIILGVLGLFVVLVVGGLYVFRDRLSGAVDALQVGDCIDEPAEDSTITEVQHQPCTGPHDGEVFAVLTHPAPSGEAYPVVSGFDDYIQQNCIPAWEAYTARTWSTDTELTINYLHPTLSGWGEGDRGFSCYTTRVDSAKLNASIRAIGSSPLP